MAEASERTVHDHALRLHAVGELCGQAVVVDADALLLDGAPKPWVSDFACVRPRGSALALLCTKTEQTPENTIVLGAVGGCAASRYCVAANVDAVLPPDSVFVGFVYTDRSFEVVVGIFDVLRLAGDCAVALEPALKRHTRVAELLAHQRGLLRHHWAGFMGACQGLAAAGHAALPFDMDKASPVVCLPALGSQPYAVGGAGCGEGLVA